MAGGCVERDDRDEIRGVREDRCSRCGELRIRSAGLTWLHGSRVGQPQGGRNRPPEQVQGRVPGGCVRSPVRIAPPGDNVTRYDCPGACCQAWTSAEASVAYPPRMAFERISIDHRIMAGVPCVRGTRVPVATVVGMVAEGIPIKQILDDYPQLEEEDVHEALRFAAAAVDQRTIPLQPSA